MPYLELLAVALAVAAFAPTGTLAGRKITVRSDAQAAVNAMSRGFSTDPGMVQLIRTVLFLAAQHGFAIRLVHIAGTDNPCADALSRGRLELFQTLSPDADSSPSASGTLPT